MARIDLFLNKPPYYDWVNVISREGLEDSVNFKSWLSQREIRKILRDSKRQNVVSFIDEESNIVCFDTMYIRKITFFKVDQNEVKTNE